MLPGAFERQLFAALGVDAARAYRVVVLGPGAEARIALACSHGALLDRRVANVQQLAARRPAERYLGVVYIVEATKFAYGCILADFQPRSRRYKEAEVLLLPTLNYSPSERQQFEKSMGSHLVRCELARLNFFPLEQQLFSLGDVHAQDVLYNPNLGALVNQKLDLVAMQLVDVCHALRIRPYVRYLHRGAHGLPAQLAELVAQQLDTLANAKDAPADAQPAHEHRPTMLILDRSADLGAPLRHDLSFQSLALDALRADFAPPLILNEYKGGDGENAAGPASGLGGKGRGKGEGGTLREDDAVWTSLRHKHIVTVTETLTARIQELRAQNPHFADPSAEASVGDVRNMLAALPTFVKERDSVALSLDIALACMAALEKLHLKDACAFEQAAVLGSGLDAEGPAGELDFEARLADALAALLGRELPLDIKVRAFALYVIHRGGLCAQDYARVQAHAGLSQRDSDVVAGLQALGFPAIVSVDALRRQPRNWCTEYEQQPLLFARVKPGVCSVAESLLRNTLSAEEFPYAGARPSRAEEQVNLASSMRNHRQRATWAQSVAKPAAPVDKSRVAAVVFVLGGVTPSEAAALYNLADRESQQIVIGGDDFVTPDKFLQFLARLKLGRDQIGLSIDREAPVPAHLYEPVESEPKAKPTPKPTAAAPAATGQRAPATMAPPQAGPVIKSPIKVAKSSTKASSKESAKSVPVQSMAVTSLEPTKDKEKTTMKRLRGAFKLSR